MELHKKISIPKTEYIDINTDYLSYFNKSLLFVNKYYSEDYNRTLNTNFFDIDPTLFFKEYVFCVCVSGFNSKIISKLFPELLIAFQPLMDMIAGKLDTVNSIDVAMDSMHLFRNKRKIKSIIDYAFILMEKIKLMGWETYKMEELNSPDKLQKLPFIGPITCFHLARNIGLLDNVKPDLHLTRLSKLWGFDNPRALCEAIQTEYNLPLGMIDLVLFYAASTFGSKS